MQQPPINSYPISDFLQWRGGEQLDIAPRFQRRSVWSPKARSYLIDSVLRGMPIPPVFIRMTMDLVRKRALREVVDGQQRLRAILEYIRGDFAVLPVHNEEFGNNTFQELPEDIQTQLLAYRLPVYTLENIADADVLKIFARLNTYTIPLNDQELRNAEFFGAFKQTVYTIAYQHYSFWRSNRILTDESIARMADAELVSEILATLLGGFQTTKDKELRRFYTEFDDGFSDALKFRNEFERVLEAIGFIFGDRIRLTRFRSVPLFFSLFCLLYDALFGLPGSDHRRVRIRTKEQAEQVFAKLKELSDAIPTKTPPEHLQPFVDASRRATADPGRRRTRHDFLWSALEEALRG